VHGFAPAAETIVIARGGRDGPGTGIRFTHLGAFGYDFADVQSMMHYPL
jgi:hypothetical protein